MEKVKEVGQDPVTIKNLAVPEAGIGEEIQVIAGIIVKKGIILF